MLLHVLQRKKRDKIPNASGVSQLMNFIPQKGMNLGGWQSELLDQCVNIVRYGL